MPISERQKTAFNDSNSHINLFVGPVRAGKSFISLLRWIDYCKNGPKGELVACGRNQDTLKRNFVVPMMDMLGKLITFYPGKKEVEIFGRTIYLIGANDERATGKIQGSTFAGAWVDEVTLLPRSFFLMLLSRLSVPGAQLFGTTNPDSPYHWLKKEFIDVSKNDKDYLTCHDFNLDDNPSLTDTFKENLKKSYTGMWYQRYILGEWVLAEGSVFDFFDPKLHVYEKPHTYAKYYLFGIDYGTTNPFALVVIGYNDDHSPLMWVEDEWYYDSRAMGRQMTDAEYCKVVKDYYNRYIPRMCYIDPTAASFHLEMKRARLPVKPSNNDILDGIRFLSNLMMQGDIVICKQASNLIKEIQGYVWDEKSVIKGVDEPIKRNDHSVDALRYCTFTHYGNRHSLKESRSDQARNPNDPFLRQDLHVLPGWRSIPMGSAFD